MIRLKALRVVDIFRSVEACAVSDLRLSLDDLRRNHFATLGDVLPVGPIEEDRSDSGYFVKPGTHVIQTESGPKRFFGFIIARHLGDLVEYLSTRVLPEPRTALATWLRQGGSMDAPSIAEAIYGETLVPVSKARGNRLLGVHMLTADTQVPLHPFATENSHWWVSKGEAQFTVRMTHPLKIGDAEVPTVRFVTFREHDVVWWNGRSMGKSVSLERLPGEVQDSLSDAVLELGSALHAPPLNDHKPVFLVEMPGRRGNSGPVRSAPPWPRVARLFPTTSPVPLIDAEGKPLDLPVFRGEQALAIAGRRNTNGFYLPGGVAYPEDLPNSSQWLVGTEPLAAA